MFAPNTAQSIEISAEWRRAETELWATHERLARVARGDRSSWLTARFARVLDLVRLRAPVEGKLAEATASV